MFGTPPGQAATSSSDYALFRLRQLPGAVIPPVKRGMDQKQSRQKELYDRKAHGVPFTEDDRVWLNCPAVP